jgi:hypothetical protein
MMVSNEFEYRALGPCRSCLDIVEKYMDSSILDASRVLFPIYSVNKVYTF